jgi:hypothetical protein
MSGRFFSSQLRNPRRVAERIPLRFRLVMRSTLKSGMKIVETRPLRGVRRANLGRAAQRAAQSLRSNGRLTKLGTLRRARVRTGTFGYRNAARMCGKSAQHMWNFTQSLGRHRAYCVAKQSNTYSAPRARKSA